MSQDCQKPPLEPARIDWQEATPVSVQFADVYFSRDDGAAETRYVFLEQNNLPQRWADWQSPGSFTIAETGFGTGLNFFCAWELWQQQRQPGQHLHFVSVEKFPLQREDLDKACALRPQFAPLHQALLAQYPPLIPGLHRLHFPAEQLTLTLIFDDAIEGFRRLDGCVDAWFLDGFAPARNPLMWQPALFAQMARLSHDCTTFATFTAAGDVKRGLRDVGFTVEKHPGYGRKRDMLKGQFTAAAKTEFAWKASDAPWFRVDYQPCPPGTVAIVGAGLAGCCAAYALAQRGWQVHLLERDAAIANQASGNATGITYAKLSLHDTAQNRYYIGAYLYACRFIRQVFESAQVAPGQDWQLNGVLQLAYNADEQQAQEKLRASGLWPGDIVDWLDADATTARLGFSTTNGAVLMKNGGWLNPATLCHALLRHPRIRLSTNTALQQLKRADERWYIDDLPDGYDAVILANTFDALQLPQADHLPLRRIRGQVSHIPATPASSILQHALNYDGYINPVRNGFHCVGATFQPRNRNPELQAEDHAENLDKLREALPALAEMLDIGAVEQLDGRVGFRCQTPDYLPIVGPLPDVAQFQQQYAGYHLNPAEQTYPPCPLLPGLYVTTGFGAKGITGATLAAEILASYISGEPQPVDRDVVFALHPARFLQRALKRQGRPD